MLTEMIFLISLLATAALILSIISLTKNKSEEYEQQGSDPRIGVIMWYDDGIKAYADISYAINKKYCDSHGYDLIRDSTRRLPDRAPSWEKIPMTIEHLANYDYLVWIDADACFNRDCDDDYLHTLIRKYPEKDFILSADMPGSDVLNMGVYIVKNSDYARDLFGKMLTDEHERCKLYKDTVWEQACVVSYYKNNEDGFKDRSVVIPYGEIQTFPHGTDEHPHAWVYHYVNTNTGERTKYMEAIRDAE
jgi:hypothetical protein